MPTIELLEDGQVVRTIIADESFAESHYPGAWRWAARQEASAVPAMPRSCSPAQGLVALYVLKGITEDRLLEAINGVPDAQARYAARIAMTRAGEWHRDSASLQGLAQLLGLSDADLDALFELAATVNV
ncbi:MAG: hypothetical protein KGM60_10865 [Comamonadaceae bacterium]|nr:hypothetical protein [Comamonadaceae bacterium]